MRKILIVFLLAVSLCFNLPLIATIQAVESGDSIKAANIACWGYQYNSTTKEIDEYLGSLSDYSPGDTIAPEDLPYHDLIKCALQNEDGTINYYLNPNDWSKRADGSAADLTGTDGDVVQVLPKIYEKHTL